MKNSNKFNNWQKKFKVETTKLGLTNKNYILDRKWFLRHSPIIKNPFLQRENEIETLHILENTRINIPIEAFYYDSNNRFLYVSEFQPESVNFGAKKLNETNLVKVANKLKQLHAVNHQQSKIKQLNMIDNLQKHIDQVKGNYHEKISEFYKLMFKFLKKNPIKTEELVISHNDFMKENILVDKDDNYYIIDFEYSGLNIKYYDYAVFITSTNMMAMPELHKFWLNQIIDTKDLKAVEMMMYYTLYRGLIGYFWAANMFETTKNKVYKNLAIYKGQQSEICFKMLISS